MAERSGARTEEQTKISRETEQLQVVERPFVSHVPLLGPLIAGLRNAWLNVAARWYVRPLTQQQNQLNRLLHQQLTETQSRLVHMDQANTQLVHQLGALSTTLVQLNRQLEEIEKRLDRLEAEQGSRADGS